MSQLASPANAQKSSAPPQNVVWTPTPRQTEFLECPDWEVLYGGAAGGGKSDGLLIDAWGGADRAFESPNHRAVIFRKQFVDLQQLIERGKEVFPMLMPGTKYNQQTHTFTAPSGAQLMMAHCANDTEAVNWRGFAWNYLGFEELTLWATGYAYHYLKGRCRTTDRRLPRYIRATTNPDGPGQKWVMEHWGIQEDGGPSCIEKMQEFEELDPETGKLYMVMRRVRRRFIPARLSDNPHLAGTGYRENLTDLPPEEREQLLEGKWTGNRVKGAYFIKEMQRARAQNRICLVPHLTGVPVNTFWDLGWNDTTAIWFHQYAALCNRFMLAYENSGEQLAFYAKLLQEMSTLRGYVYGTHYLPHDAANVSLQTGKSAEMILKALLPGHRFQVVPRVEQKLMAIDAARASFPSCWFDRDDCADGIAALDAYRKKWNKTLEVYYDEPVHDRFSNYADAFQQFGQGFHTPAHGGLPGNRREGGSRTANPSDWKRA